MFAKLLNVHNSLLRPFVGTDTDQDAVETPEFVDDIMSEMNAQLEDT